jgi:uncharacterized protein YbaR (Trm112 family)
MPAMLQAASAVRADRRFLYTPPMVDAELLEILVCPEDKTPVTLASAETLATLNARIAAGGVKTRGGAAVTDAITEGLVRADGRYLYPVREDIPVMLIDEAIPL